jgi:hypothetical protein
MQQFCASHKQDTTHFFRKKKDVYGVGKTQAVIVDHKETYEFCF